MADLVISVTQQATITAKIEDRKGNPAPVDGAPLWAVTGPLTLTPAPDGLSALVAANGELGEGQVSVNADADLTPGVETITGSCVVSVIAGKAATITLEPGTPTEQAA